MTYSIKTLILTSVSGLALLALALLSIPVLAQAATYAYVDATGEVRSVVADDWMTAIATAPNIHINSGVYTLSTADDYDIIGEDIR
jgi:hypothetical protein